jgi:hypothetical protein
MTRAAALGAVGRWWLDRRWFLIPLLLPISSIGAGLALGYVFTMGWPLALPAATVDCYSAGRRIYSGRAPAGPGVDRTWSGVRFRDEHERRIRIRGDCVVIYDRD